MTDLDDRVASSLREIAGEADTKVRRVDLSAVLAEGSKRSRRRRRQRQTVATAALIAAIILVFVVPLPHLLLRHRAGSTTVTTVPNTSTHKVREGHRKRLRCRPAGGSVVHDVARPDHRESGRGDRLDGSRVDRVGRLGRFARGTAPW